MVSNSYKPYHFLEVSFETFEGLKSSLQLNGILWKHLSIQSDGTEILILGSIALLPIKK